MKLRILGLILIIFTLFLATCKTKEGTSGVKGTQSDTPFDPKNITEQQYASTMEEVQIFINELNRIIAARNFQQWRVRLSPECFERFSSPEFLAEVSEQPAMKTRRVVLRSAEDYFRHVVIPSRQDSRVDSIEFLGRDKVIAYTISVNRAGEEVRLRLYDLEKINNSWIIIN